MTEDTEKTNSTLENKGGPYADALDETGKTPTTRKRYFRIFEAFALEMKPIHEIAKDFGVSKQTVYVALEWVRKYEPEISHGVRLLSAIKAKEESVRLMRRERDAILKFLDDRRKPEFNLKDYKGPTYNHYQLNAVMMSLKAEEDALWKFYDIVKDTVGDALNKLNTNLEEALPLVFSHLAGVRPKKHDEPIPSDKLQPGITTGSVEAPAENQG